MAEYLEEVRRLGDKDLQELVRQRGIRVFVKQSSESLATVISIELPPLKKAEHTDEVCSACNLHIEVSTSSYIDPFSEYITKVVENKRHKEVGSCPYRMMQWSEGCWNDQFSRDEVDTTLSELEGFIVKRVGKLGNAFIPPTPQDVSRALVSSR